MSGGYGFIWLYYVIGKILHFFDWMIPKKKKKGGEKR